MNQEKTPLWHKYALTVDQTAELFGIGQKKIRNLITLYKDANWLLLNGERTLIKRRLFEDFLDNTGAI